MLEGVDDQARVAGFNGLTLLVDEIDSLSVDEKVYTQVAYFFKGAREKLRADGHLDISFVVAGVSGAVTDLITRNPSFARVFENIDLRRMEAPELEEIIDKALQGTDVGIAPAAKRRLIELSDGFPEIVQLLGHHMFRFDEDNSLDLGDLDKALRYVVRELKRQEFSDLKAKAERSRRRARILKVLAETSAHALSVRDISLKTGLRADVVGGLVREMASASGDRLGVLLSKSGREHFRFRDPLFRTYFRWALGLTT